MKVITLMSQKGGKETCYFRGLGRESTDLSDEVRSGRSAYHSANYRSLSHISLLISYWILGGKIST